MQRRRNRERVSPSQWNEDRTREAFELALLGATDIEVAAVFGVDTHTIELWKRTRPEFLAALNRGKIIADARVAHSLYRRATGFEYEEDVSHVCNGEVIVTRVTRYEKPDSWAAARWLSLRRRRDWAEVQRAEITNTQININRLDLSSLSTEELMLMKSIINKQKNQLPQNASNN